MKTRKTRILALLATLVLLVTGVFSSVSVSAESYLYSGTTNTAMAAATVTFLDTDNNGYYASGTNKTQTIQNYNEYRSESNGKGTTDTGGGYWILLDRFVGMSSDVIYNVFDSFYASGANNYLVAEWDVIDQRFEITEFYPADNSTRRALEIPRHGFVLINYGTLTSSNFFSRLAKGRGIEIQMDAIVSKVVTNANAKGYNFEYKTYADMILDSTADYKVPRQVSNITISTVDTYKDTSTAKDLTGAALSFHPDVFNGQMYDDWIGLYNHQADMSEIKQSGRGLYIPLEKVSGTENTYQIKSGYTVPNYNDTTSKVPTSIPEGEYLLCMTFAVSSYLNYNASNSGNTSYLLYLSLKKYFAAGKKFKIEFSADVETADAGSVRVKEPAGLRFKTTVGNYNELVSAGYTVDAGTMILPADYLPADKADWDEAYTMDALNTAGKTYLNIARTTWAVDPTTAEDGKGEMLAAIVNIKSGNYEREFAARGYVTITKDGVSKTFYSDTIAVRSVYDVATAALEDTETVYTEAETAVLKQFAKQS